MVAPLELARTWLLERTYTRPDPSRTRAPMVLLVIAGCPTEKPGGAGRWRLVGSLKAVNRPVTRNATGIPSSAAGRPAMPSRSRRTCMPTRPSGRRAAAVPTTPGIFRSPSVWRRRAAMAPGSSGARHGALDGGAATGAVGDAAGRSEHANHTAVPAARRTATAARINVRAATMATPGFKIRGQARHHNGTLGADSASWPRYFLWSG